MFANDIYLLNSQKKWKGEDIFVYLHENESMTYFQSVLLLSKIWIENKTEIVIFHRLVQNAVEEKKEDFCDVS